MVRFLLSSVLAAQLSAPSGFASEGVPSRHGINPRVITMAVFDECAVSHDVVALAQQETTRVWSRADVAIRWVRSSELPFSSPPTDWLMVRCMTLATLPNGSERSQVMAIAAIRFVGSRPTNSIVLNIANATTLLKRELPGGQAPGTLIPFHDTRMGRMLGRAIAHEVGHFLTQSGAHTRRGLMRATHTIAALTGPSLGPFKVDSTEIAALYADRGTGAGATP